MYQDSGCSSSSSRRGSSSAAAAAATAAAATSTAAAATATTTAAAATTTAATTTTAAATTTSSSDEETLETLTIITTTITDSDIHATTTTTTVIASGTATTAATATLATLATLATAAAATAVAATGATGVATGATGAAATAATATASSDIEDSSLVESEESEECEYIEIDCQTTTAQEGTSPSGGSSSSGNAVLLQRSSNNHRHQQQQQQQQHHQQEQQQQLQLQLQQADVRLLRKIGYIASRVRCLAKFYGDFRLVNPYSARRQRRQLQEILLRHSIFDPGKEHQRAIVLAAATAAIAGPLAAIDCACGSSSISLEAVSSRSRSSELEEERHEDEEEEDRQEQEQQQQKEDHQQLQELKEQVLKDHQHLEEGDPPPPAIAVTTTTATTTVRRKSSTSSTISGTATVSGSVSVSASASQSFCSNNINLLEELLIQFYEEQDHRGNLTVIRHHHHHHQQQQQQQHQQQQQQQRITNNNNNNNCNSIQNNNNMSNPVAAVAAPVAAATQVATSAGGGGASTGATLDQPATSSGTSCTTTTTSATQHHLQPTQLPDGSDNNPRRRRASDCSAVQAALQNQLHCITLKNNNCGKALPFHRGSCGAAGEHLLAANSIANRATIILSKSCSNVDGDGATTALSPAGFGGNKMRASATDIESNAMNGARDVMVASNNGNGNGNNGNNGNNEYSILQLNNTIIQCHFNDGDFRALVKDLKRKVEYTERMNWLCLSKRPMGPPHRKSSLPKHQEVKRRFLEICDTTFSEEVRAALRLPAFDSYEWGDADVIHLMQTMFVELGFIEKFSIPVDTLREWLYEVYKHYNEVPFHNFRHCFCVAQMMYAITRQANLLSRLGDLECLILLVSCICHDLDHPGYNNIYQINARTELALRYNDISPLENHHCSIAFRLLEHPECNIFKNFSRDTFNNIREGIIRCILATDMARHNEILTQFIEITPVFDYSNRAHINLLCMILIKVADISNEARPMDVAEPWLDRLLQEFFAQSAAEKSEGLPVTPFMDPDKVSKPGSQVRFIGLVLLPLFEALGELVPELTDLIIIPVRIALEYYRRLNDAQTKTRKSVADSNTSATSDSNSGTIDSNAAMVSTPGGASDKLSLDKAQGNSQGSGGGAGGAGGTGSGSGSGGGGAGGGSGGGGGGGGGGGSGGGNNAAGSVSPQMPRSGSGISVKSRRSIPSQKSASRTSVDEPGGMAAELHDLPEGSESGDSETATEVDVAEKTSKFKVDTEGSSNRSKSSHSTSRKSSREKRPSMIGELCSSGGGQRIRNSYGNIHGYHSNRCHFGNNRAVSLDQYSSGGNNRRLSDGLPQVISDSNVFYGRHNRSSMEATSGGGGGGGGGVAGGVVVGIPQDTNANTNHPGCCQLKELLARTEADSDSGEGEAKEDKLPLAIPAGVVGATASSSNGNISPPLAVTEQILPSNGSTRSSASSGRITAAGGSAGGAGSGGGGGGGGGVGAAGPSAGGGSSWKSRLRQFSDYFSFSFDKGNKRFGSTRSSPCPGSNSHSHSSSGRANNNANGLADNQDGGGGGGGALKSGMCCTITGSPGKEAPTGGHLTTGTNDAHQRHRAYSLDVPGMMRYSSNDSSRHPSNNTLQSSGGGGGGAGTTTVERVPPSVSVEIGLASGSPLEAGPKI